jgi:predicted nucleic acid-binding protein
MIYIDSGIILRMIEGADKVRLPIEARLAQLDPAQRVLATSRLSTLECRCKPLREQNAELLVLYNNFFIAGEIQLLEIDRAVIDKATEVRAVNGLKTPDAIHLATAQSLNVAAFWTTDRRLARTPGVTFELFPAV